MQDAHQKTASLYAFDMTLANTSQSLRIDTVKHLHDQLAQSFYRRHRYNSIWILFASLFELLGF